MYRLVSKFIGQFCSSVHASVMLICKSTQVSKKFVWGVALLRIETYCLHLQPRDFLGSNLQSPSRREEIPLTEFHIVDSLWYSAACWTGFRGDSIIVWAVGHKFLKSVISRPPTWAMSVCGSTKMRFCVDVGMLVREYTKGLLNFRVECLDSQNI